MHSIELLGYVPGVIGEITTLHARYYHAHWGFDASFETQVGRECSLFVEGFKPEKDGLWTAWYENRFQGSIAVEGEPAGDTGARLRWFIVDPAMRGQNIGSRLLRLALNFCDEKQFASVYLWTFAGLVPARHLYEKFGFSLVQEIEAEQWGSLITAQKFIRQRD